MSINKYFWKDESFELISFAVIFSCIKIIWLRQAKIPSYAEKIGIDNDFFIKNSSKHMQLSLLLKD